MIISRLALLTLLLFPDLAAGSAPILIAPRTVGPMIGISWTVSAAMSGDHGWAIWRVGSASIWGVPLDASGQPTGLARPLVTNENINYPAIEKMGGSLVLLWQNGLGATRLARLDQEGLIGDIATHRLSRGDPLVASSTLLMTRGSISLVKDVLFFTSDLERSFRVPLTGTGVAFGMDAVTLRDGSFAVAVTSYDGLFLVRLDAEGAPLGSPLLIEAARGTSGTAWRPQSSSIATDGDSILIAWSAGAYQEPRKLETALVRSDGSLIRRDPIETPAWMTLGHLRTRFADGVYTTFFSAGNRNEQGIDDLDIYAFRSSAAGELVAGPRLIMDLPFQQRPAEVLTTAIGHVMLFHHGSYGAEEILTVAVPRSGPLERQDVSRADASIAQAPALQQYAAVAAGGDEWLAVWLERIVGREEIRAVALRPNGVPKSAPVVLASQDQYLGYPSVSYNGVDYVVSWVQWGGVHASRVTRDGVALDRIRIPGPPPPITPISMASRSGLTLLAWSHQGEIHGGTVRADGTVSYLGTLNPAIPPQPDDAVGHYNPIVAASDHGFLLTWTITRTSFCVGIPCPSTSNAAIRLLDSAGNPVPGFTEVPEARPTSVAGGSDTYLAIYDNDTARLVDARSGAVSDAFGPFDTLPHGITVALWRNGEYVVVARSPNPSTHFVRRISGNGTAGDIDRLLAFALPRAANASGHLLAIGLLSEGTTPDRGALAVELVDTFLPGSGLPARSRGVRR